MKVSSLGIWIGVATGMLPTLLLSGCGGGNNSGGPLVPEAPAALPSQAASTAVAYAGTYSSHVILGSGKTGTLKIVVSSANKATATVTPSGTGAIASSLTIVFTPSTGALTLTGNVKVGTQQVPVKLNGQLPSGSHVGFIKGTINGVTVNVALTRVVVTPTPTPTKTPVPPPVTFNTVTFSALSGTNATTTPYIPSSRVANAYPGQPTQPTISFTLNSTVGDKTRLISFLIIGPSDGSGVKAGHAYPISSSEEPNGYGSGTYSDSVGSAQNIWAMTGGTITIDSISGKTYNVHLANITMEPAPVGSGAKGKFTINFKGDTTSPF